MQVMSFEALTKPEPSDAQLKSMTSSPEYALPRTEKVLRLRSQQHVWMLLTN